MTIRKGEPWGEIGTAPGDLVIIRSDPELHRWVVRHREADQPIAPLGLGGGDLARTAGGGGADRFRGPVAHVPLDLVRVEADGRVTWSAAHVVARRSWLTGPVLFAMTAQYLDGLDLAPRSHPNDGRVDVLEVAPAMSVRQRISARRRARTGTHLPHPSLSTRQVSQFDITFARPQVIWVDGVRWATAGSLRLVVEPDAYTAYV